MPDNDSFRDLITWKADGTPKPDRSQAKWPRISCNNFIELCEELAVEDEKVFENLFTTLGLSVDWSRTYCTIDAHSLVSQPAFRKDLEAGNAYMAEAPTMGRHLPAPRWPRLSWKTRNAPARTTASASTAPTARRSGLRPPAPSCCPPCVALVAHPDDERYQPLFGTTVTLPPLFGVEVEIKAHPLAQPDKGAGIAMICTFGDTHRRHLVA